MLQPSNKFALHSAMKQSRRRWNARGVGRDTDTPRKEGPCPSTRSGYSWQHSRSYPGHGEYAQGEFIHKRRYSGTISSPAGISSAVANHEPVPCQIRYKSFWALFSS